MTEIADKTREEFFSEAQEIIETLSRNLLAIDALSKQGRSDPSLVNEAFRAVHTLKGLAGLFGASRIGTASHLLEDLLDDVRLGRKELSTAVLDALFLAVEAFNQLLTAERSSADRPIPALDELITRVAALGGAAPSRPDREEEYELDPGMLAVLTEYEEHRLRSNIDQGQNLYRLRVTFDLATIDKALEEIKERARLHGEIITYLPTGQTSGGDTIELDLMMASSEELEALVEALAADHVVVEAIPRRRRPETGRAPPPSLIASAAPPPADGGGGAVAARREEGNQLTAVDHREASLRSVSQTVRVDIHRLDHLMNVVGELAIVRSALARITERLRGEGQRQVSSELLRLHRSFDRRLTELQDGILEVRMVPLGQIFDRLARVVRQLSRDAGKEIRLVITGAETEIDKLIVEELSDPLMHMIRNAIDHGIEAGTIRAGVGKPSAGTIALNAFQKGSHVLIEIEDDGAGIDEEALLQRAVALGAVSAADATDLSRDELLALVFVPGLSTRAVASEVSGRGVGMDVVKTNIGKLGGVIDVQSERGIGTKLTITLPITLAIVSALIVDVGGRTFAIPLATVSEAIRLDEAGVRVLDGREVMSLRGSTLPLCRLARLFRVEVAAGPRRQFVIVAAVGARRLGLIVDQLYGQQDIVIKPLGRSLRDVRGFAGATELGDQRIGLVIDAAALIEEQIAAFEGRDRARRQPWATS